MTTLAMPLTNNELSQAALALNEDNNVSFVFVLSFERKEGRRWVTDSMVFFSNDGRALEEARLVRLFGDRVRSFVRSSKIVYS